MLSRESGVPVETLREAARLRVEETSLRVAAGEIGMSHRGLEDFIGGTNPHASTAKKLTEWYLKRAAAGKLEIASEIAEAALAVLTRHVARDRTTEARMRVLEVLRLMSEAEAVPQWIEELIKPRR